MKSRIADGRVRMFARVYGFFSLLTHGVYSVSQPPRKETKPEANPQGRLFALDAPRPPSNEKKSIRRN